MKSARSSTVNFVRCLHHPKPTETTYGDLLATMSECMQHLSYEPIHSIVTDPINKSNQITSFRCENIVSDLNWSNVFHFFLFNSMSRSFIGPKNQRWSKIDGRNRTTHVCTYQKITNHIFNADKKKNEYYYYAHRLFTRRIIRNDVMQRNYFGSVHYRSWTEFFFFFFWSLYSKRNGYY